MSDRILAPPMSVLKKASGPNKEFSIARDLIAFTDGSLVPRQPGTLSVYLCGWEFKNAIHRRTLDVLAEAIDYVALHFPEESLFVARLRAWHPNDTSPLAEVCAVVYAFILAAELTPRFRLRAIISDCQYVVGSGHRLFAREERLTWYNFCTEPMQTQYRAHAPCFYIMYLVARRFEFPPNFNFTPAHSTQTSMHMSRVLATLKPDTPYAEYAPLFRPAALTMNALAVPAARELAYIAWVAAGCSEEYELLATADAEIDGEIIMQRVIDREYRNSGGVDEYFVIYGNWIADKVARLPPAKPGTISGARPRGKA